MMFNCTLSLTLLLGGAVVTQRHSVDTLPVAPRHTNSMLCDSCIAVCRNHQCPIGLCGPKDCAIYEHCRQPCCMRHAFLIWMALFQGHLWLLCIFRG
uniref:Putative secreted protein n=1 Tax=Amblyomma cajennense TaxID=34607 RepID=A0A023FBV9_AMBCJ